MCVCAHGDDSVSSLLTLFWTAVLHARAQALEAVGIPLTSPVEKQLTLHGGHVEEVIG